MKNRQPTKLPSNEAALVTTNDMTDWELLLPQFDDDENVPDLVVLLAGFMIRVQSDPEFVAEMGEWIATHKSGSKFN